jgi:hypothetical protein
MYQTVRADGSGFPAENRLDRAGRPPVRLFQAFGELRREERKMRISLARTDVQAALGV